MLRSYGEKTAVGMSDLDARKAVASEHAAATGVPPRTADTRVRQIVSRYHERNAIPSQLNELAAIAGKGDAPAIHETYRAGVNLKDGNEAASRAAQFVQERQPQVGAALSAALEKQLGDGDVARMIADYEAKRVASGADYGKITEAFNDSPEAQNALRAALNNAKIELTSTLGNRADPMAAAMRKEMDAFFNPYLTKAGADHQGTSYLNAFIHQRRALGDAIGASKDQFGKATATTRDLTNLKGMIDRNVRGIAEEKSGRSDAVRSIFGDWAAANDERAGTEALTRAYREGMSINLGAKKGASLEAFERTMGRVEKMGSEHSEMFARGLMAQLKASIETGDDFANAARLFTNKRMRNVLEQMLGKEDAAYFYGLVRRAGLAKRSQLADKGSQTASIQNVQSGWDAISRLYEAATNILSLPFMLRRGAEWATKTLRNRRATQIMDVLGSSTQEPHKLSQSLDLIRRATADLAQPVQGGRHNLLPAPMTNPTQISARAVSGPFVPSAIEHRRDELPHF